MRAPASGRSTIAYTVKIRSFTVNADARSSVSAGSAVTTPARCRAGTKTRRDELVGSLRGKRGLRRYLRRTKSGLLRIDHTAANGRRTWTASGCYAPPTSR